MTTKRKFKRGDKVTILNWWESNISEKFVEGYNEYGNVDIKISNYDSSGCLVGSAFGTFSEHQLEFENVNKRVTKFEEYYDEEV